ncbi:MAG: putative bifunctional diguanylate cyclase/phosphodiesterase, partial [Janthinobacterium lividum]
GLLSPDEFIPISEETGLIVPLGEWVLRRACADAATWPNGIKVAVNLSPAQFREPRLVDMVRAALTSSGLSPSRLVLEITESVLLQRSETTLAILQELHDLGTPISMDDFGTGYSSLSYLQSFPFDKIKIDKSFVRDLNDKESAAHIVRAVAGLGVNLGMLTTAEGVETLEQLQQLRLEGCSEVQGYLFSRPRPKEDIPEILDHARVVLNAEARLGRSASTTRDSIPIA